MDVSIATSRLLLRPLSLADVPAIVVGLSDFEVARWLTPVPHPYTVDHAKEWLAKVKPAQPGALHLAIDLAGAGLIGVASIDPGLGYWIDGRHHGRGYLTEASAALLDWHFGHLPHSSLRSGAHVGNEASLRVQAKLGFRETGIRDMRHVRSLGHEVEHIETSLDRPQFEAARKREWAL